jgi:sulfur dioxygenase
VIIDPCEDTVDRDAAIINELGLQLKYAVNTHCHADHISGTWKLKKIFASCKSAISTTSGAECDIPLEDNQELEFGVHSIRGMATPGHTVV